MNGVRRFLGGGGGSSSTPSSQNIPLPSSPPNAGLNGLEESPKVTAGLNFRKQRNGTGTPSRQSDDDGNSSFHSSRNSAESGRTSTQPSSPVAGPSSPRQPLPMRVAELSRNGERRRSASFNSKDDLLISLLASEAVVDSRGFDILSAEEVEELKKESQVLSTRLAGLQKKLALETKLRDAAESLSRANASLKGTSKQSSEQLENANRKVDTTQKELWRISEKSGEVNRRLLEHRAGVLSYSVRSLEKQIAGPDAPNGDISGSSTPNRNSAMSPTQSSVFSSQSTSSRSKFDGAHFFAGHSDAIVPKSARSGASSAELTALQEQLKVVQDALDVANSQQEKTARELLSLRKEKTTLESSKDTELQRSEDTIAMLERQVGELNNRLLEFETEKMLWENDRIELDGRRREVDTLQRKVVVLEEGRSGELTEIERKLDQKDREIAELKAERAALLTEQVTLRDGGKSKVQLEEGVDALQELMRLHGVSHYSRDVSVRGLAASIGKHLEETKVKVDSHSKAQEEWAAMRAKLEGDVRAGFDKREAMGAQLEEARRDRDAARAEMRGLDQRLKEITESSGPLVQYTGDAAKITEVLEPIWSVLPSPEARAQKMGKSKGVMGSPILGSPKSGSVSPGGKGGASLSEMDVRSLKTLYDPNGFPLSARPSGPDVFTVEAFAARVQALIADDRALIERLIRFAQAHDLLKKNAERAQKLAQESNAALETYQKQVKLLEDRNVTMIAKQTSLQDEVASLQEAVDRVTAEKLELETRAAEQAETCSQLTEANNTLSARVLRLAEESNGASTSDVERKKAEAERKRLAEELSRVEAEKTRLEGELTKSKAALEKAQEDVDAIRISQQTQQMALLEELNTVQTENTSLRAQLRKK